MGIPGSGKSTYLNNIAKDNAVIVSRDEIRFSMLKDNENYFEQENKVFDTFINTIQTAIDNNYSKVFVDATHLNEKSRCKLLNRIDLKDYELCFLYFKVPLNICIARNSNRTGRAFVPPSVITNMHKSLINPAFDRRYNNEEVIVITEKEENEWLSI